MFQNTAIAWLNGFGEHSEVQAVCILGKDEMSSFFKSSRNDYRNDSQTSAQTAAFILKRLKEHIYAEILQLKQIKFH